MDPENFVYLVFVNIWSLHERPNLQVIVFGIVFRSLPEHLNPQQT